MVVEKWAVLGREKGANFANDIFVDMAYPLHHKKTFDISGLSLIIGSNDLSIGFFYGNLRLDRKMICIAIAGDSDEDGQVYSFSTR